MGEVLLLFQIFTATLAVSLISFVGATTMVVSEERVKKILLLLVGFSAGALIGGAFLHLIPEALELSGKATEPTFLGVIGGFVFFFILEKLMWRHCHEKECKIHSFAYLNLMGDGVHNFIDGLIIATSFIASPQIGIVSSIAVALHEIPQELGDFGVLVYGGMKPKKALFFNFLTALTAIAGGTVGYAVLRGSGMESAKMMLLPFTAGGFLYIAASDLIPELHKEPDKAKTVLSFASFVMGIALMWAMKLIVDI